MVRVRWGGVVSHFGEGEGYTSFVKVSMFAVESALKLEKCFHAQNNDGETESAVSSAKHADFGISTV